MNEEERLKMANQLWEVVWEDGDGEIQTTQIRGGVPVVHAAVVRRCGGRVVNVRKVDG